MDEKLIAKHMNLLGISREEAIQLIEDDKAIDKGAKMFDLDPELEKGAKKARQADRKVPTTPVKREKKAKPEKAEICSAMMDGLKSLGNCNTMLQRKTTTRSNLNFIALRNCSIEFCWNQRTTT